MLASRTLHEPSAILTIEKVADRSAPGLIHFTLSLAFVRVQATCSGVLRGLGGAALWTAVGEPGLIWLQLELFRADDANLDRKRHASP